MSGDKIENKTDFCPKCKSWYPKGTTHKCSNNTTNEYSNVIVLGVLLVFIMFIFYMISSCSSSTSVNENKRFEDMTNKEYQDFMDWSAKQKQKEWENQKAFQ